MTTAWSPQRSFISQITEELSEEETEMTEGRLGIHHAREIRDFFIPNDRKSKLHAVFAYTPSDSIQRPPKEDLKLSILKLILCGCRSSSVSTVLAGYAERV